MNVLEKILEEIKQYTEDVYECDLDDIVEYQRRNREDNCTYIVQGIEEATEFIRSHMDEAKDANAPSNDGWIPVEERLPEHDYETVLCVDAVDYYFVAVYTKKDGFRTEDFGADYENIIAWQPLPEPYRLKEQNDGE